MQFIRRLFGRADEVGEERTKQDSKRFHDHAYQSSESASSDRYFDTLMRMQQAIRSNEFEEAGKLVRLNMGCIPIWITETRRQFGSFDIPSIPALQQGGTILAVVGDEEGLRQMQELIEHSPELIDWAERVQQHRIDIRLVEKILEEVGKNPGCLQTEVKGLIGESDGRRVARLISYLERARKIIRIKKGRTYQIAIVGAIDVPEQPAKKIVGSHRRGQSSINVQEIDLANLSYVPLPHSPPKWEESARLREQDNLAAPIDHFEVRDTNWQIESITGIPMSERPDPAFRQVHPCESGILMIDDLAKAEGLGNIEAAALRYDRSGCMVAKLGLRHGTYRVGVHPLGQGMIAMSRDCEIHIYDDQLGLVLETGITEAPEVLALRKRFDIPDKQLKNHIRCVALSETSGSYLYTGVDEAWCVDLDGKGLWGAKLPIKEGWSRVTTPSPNFHSSSEVEDALSVMGLTLPIDPEEVKQRYRSLAKQWHPDLNPGLHQAQEKMKSINLAAETLTSIEVSTLPRYADATFVQELDASEFEVGGHRFSVTMTMSVGEIHAADWIYAACFAAKSDSVYLAGYSGRVVQVDENGQGLRAYDIGSVPRRIIDTGDYLYLLTDTRLYILSDDKLVALKDTFSAGDLVVAQTGFGLMENKRFRWFREDGQYLGEVVSRHPIRRVYSVNDRMIVETRQHRATIRGVPRFWE